MAAIEADDRDIGLDPGGGPGAAKLADLARLGGGLGRPALGGADKMAGKGAPRRVEQQSPFPRGAQPLKSGAEAARSAVELTVAQLRLGPVAVEKETVAVAFRLLVSALAKQLRQSRGCLVEAVRAHGKLEYLWGGIPPASAA